MESIAVWLLLLAAVVAQGHSPPSTSTNEYYVGFLKNYGQENLTLYITTTENVPVPFTVSSSTGQMYSGTATDGIAIDVTLPSSFAVFNNTVRDKGVWIRATDASNKLTVYGMNYASRTADGFVALPCYDYQIQNYTYYAVSTHFNRFPEVELRSQVLLVGCEDSTELTITPTQTIEIPSNLAGGNTPVTVIPGRSYTITLNRLQTFLFSSSLDLTGSMVVSNKPIAFFSGHECADVPVGVAFCDHLVEQLPPTITWGRQFFVVSSLGKIAGEQYKLITSTTTTAAVCYCSTSNGTVSETFITTLTGAGRSHEFHIAQDMFCSVQASSPVLLVQFAIGRSREPSEYGDPFMMMIPPVEQYRNNYTFLTQSGFQNTISITVGTEFFNPENLVLNGSSLSGANWTEIYCSTHIVCGYATRVSLSVGQNFIYHRDPTARLGTFVYGFRNYTSYGYPAGMQLIPTSVDCGHPVASQNGPLESYTDTTNGLVVFYSCDPASPSTAANEYYVGFSKNYQGQGTTTLFITTTESAPVFFTVSSSTGQIYSDIVTNSVVSSVTLPSSFAVLNNTVRDKGVWVRATDGSRKLTVHGMNNASRTADGFVALPCYDYQIQNYTFYAVSTHFNRSSTPLISQVLLVGCEESTELTITPTQAIQIPPDLVMGSNLPLTVPSGGSYTVTLDRLQTFMFHSTLDLTGSKVVSNKPIAFFSGHECADVPVGVAFCDHLVEQLPPTITWGRRFFVVSSLGKIAGEQYKLITSSVTTAVVCYCSTSNGTVSETFITTLSGSGRSHEFHIAQNMFCSVQASSPVLLVQFAIGRSREPSEYGDPFMMMIPPVEQYRNNYTFVTQSGFQNTISITVRTESFNPENIVLNGSSLSGANWTEVYCSTHIVCGYATRVSLSVGQNFIYHRDPTARLGTFVYGFRKYFSYGYPAGMQLIPISVDCGHPVAPQNGSLASYTDTTNGSEVYYSCDPGLLPQARMRAVCTENGWSPNPADLNCTVVDCGHPVAPQNGSLASYTDTTNGSVVFYSCDPGLLPQARMRAVCTENGWSPNPGDLNCTVVDCGHPVAPQNGSLESYTDTTDGSVVFYSCDPGLLPEGRMRVVCTENGWSPFPADLNCTVETPLDSRAQPVATEHAVPSSLPQAHLPLAIGLAVSGMSIVIITSFIVVWCIIMKKKRARNMATSDTHGEQVDIKMNEAVVHEYENVAHEYEDVEHEYEVVTHESEVPFSMIKMKECEAYATLPYKP